MIVDNLDNQNLYRGTSAGLDRAFDYISQTEFGKLPDGRQEIDGDDLYALVLSYTPKKEEDQQYEAHRNYIDIQFVLKGREIIYWKPVERLQAAGAYSEKDDAVLSKELGGTAVTLSKGYFVVLFPQDAHNPGCLWDEAVGVRKVVVKIRSNYSAKKIKKSH